MKYQFIAIAIVFLFIGVAVAPSINFTVVKASDDNDLVEVTTQACGINGFGNTTVKLTRQQYQNLEQYLVDFRERLNQTTTREEAVPIFKEAVVELDKYGLLPKGMHVELIQRLVMRRYQFSQQFLEPNYNKNHMTLDVKENRNCLITGITDNTYYYSRAMIIFDKICSELPYGNYSDLFMIFTLMIVIGGNILSWINPIAFAYRIYLGTITIIDEKNEPPEYDPATGWIYTKGTNGTITYNSPMYGYLPFEKQLFVPSAGIYVYSYGGVDGFTGIKLLLPHSRHFYLGSALWVKIGPEPPD
jgi:hypothetical protein